MEHIAEGLLEEKQTLLAASIFHFGVFFGDKAIFELTGVPVRI